MTFGCCSNMIACNPDGTGSEWIDKIAEFKYDYVELPLAQLMELQEDEIKTIKETLKKNEISCESCNNFFPVHVRLTGMDVDRVKIREYYTKALNRAKDLGALVVVFGSGPAKNVPDGYSKKEGYLQVVDLLKEVGKTAEELGITITIEPLRREECNLINTFKEGCQLAKDVGNPNIKVLVDFYHLSQEKEPVQNIVELGKEYLAHIHFARNEGRVYPESIEEDQNYRPFIHALKEIGYTGRVSCEAYTEDFISKGPLAIDFFKTNF